MIFLPPVIDLDTCIDFYAGNERVFNVLLPAWKALGKRQGVFYTSFLVKQKDIMTERIPNHLEGNAPIMIASYKDLNDLFIVGDERPFIMYEPEHNTETRGLLQTVSLFLCADDRTIKFRKTISNEVHKITDAHSLVTAIEEFIKGKEVTHYDKINGKTVGIIYVAFGKKAIEGVHKSLSTLKRLGYSYPVSIIHDAHDRLQSDDFNSIHSMTNPFDISKAKNFQFRAGRIKPQLCSLSPYDLTLYLDADTCFIQPVHDAFKMLLDNDLLVTEEKLSLGDLYNKKLAGWELNLIERDITIKELGGDASKKFINSGVLFFKKNKKTLKLFSDWYIQWMRYQEWDEQLALMRSINQNKDVKVKSLSVDWNSPHLTNSTIIFHNYGRGDVRSNL